MADETLISRVDAIMEQAQIFASTYSLVGGRFDDGSRMQQSEEEKAELRRIIETALAAEPEVKIMPRGGVERNWWEEYQLLLRRFKKLAKAARQCVEEVDVNLAKDDWPVKYRAPFGGLTKLREALPETYEEYKVRSNRPA